MCSKSGEGVSSFSTQDVSSNMIDEVVLVTLEQLSLRPELNAGLAVNVTSCRSIARLAGTGTSSLFSMVYTITKCRWLIVRVQSTSNNSRQIQFWRPVVQARSRCSCFQVFMFFAATNVFVFKCSCFQVFMFSMFMCFLCWQRPSAM